MWQQQPTAGAQQQQTAYAAAHAVAHAANAAAAQPMPQTLQGAAPSRAARRGIGQLKASEPTRQLILKRAAVGLSGGPLKKSIFTDPKWLFQLNVIKTGDFTVSKVRERSELLGFSLAAARARLMMDGSNANAHYRAPPPHRYEGSTYAARHPDDPLPSPRPQTTLRTQVAPDASPDECRR